MTETLIVAFIVLAAMLFWLGRLFPAGAAGFRSRIGLGSRVSGPGEIRKGCDNCRGCKGGGCH
ncbi:hypothetical protein [Swaminathania salitolerans]|uniref:Uncharacterized protein n=1 Tax=Swaminathania salitolerans TaxID=182838 RepID=A0A511BM80_9PROT|nr:hypothetical protein [Swaminathania salitolerans]GBQ10167.1 hypothetical protein AA21291_0333 [Swaminathania salitolerans LMG 21291]GEL01192.1 hypothetical protein SSA02_03550 [Swaminathania salitolerans]